MVLINTLKKFDFIALYKSLIYFTIVYYERINIFYSFYKIPIVNRIISVVDPSFFSGKRTREKESERTFRISINGPRLPSKQGPFYMDPLWIIV